MIDTILVEHTNTLQGVINNIRQTQQCSKLEDPLQRRQGGRIRTTPSRPLHRPSYTHRTVCQPYQAAPRAVHQPIQQARG